MPSSQRRRRDRPVVVHTTRPVTRPRIRPWTWCRVCEYHWMVRSVKRRPKICPACASRQWGPYAGWVERKMPAEVPGVNLRTCWCRRCGFVWFARAKTTDAGPARCARYGCGSPYWDRERTEGWCAA